MTLQEMKDLLKEQKDALLAAWEDKYTPLMNQIEQMEKRIVEIETKFKDRNHIPGLEEEKKEFSFFKAFYAIRHNQWDDAGFEKEVFDAARKKAMSLGTGSAGGYIVPEIYMAEIIELLQAEAVVIRMGATVLSGLVGSPVYIPRQSAGATAYWVGENSDITASDLTLEQVSMTPKKDGASTCSGPG